MTNLILTIDTEHGPDAAPLDREWLDTNGRGGYASSTLCQCHTRKYHGLLVANLSSPPGRYVLLSKFEDSLLFLGREHFLSCHRYPGVFFPGSFFLRGFELEDGPVFLYEARHTPGEASRGAWARESREKEGAATFRLRQSVRMVAGEDAVLIRYDLESCPAPAVLRLRPFLAYRGQHELSRRNPYVRNGTEPVPNGFQIAPYQGMPPLYLQTNRKNRFTAQPLWYDRFEYDREGERGYDRHEDLFTPGFLDVPCRSGETVLVRAATSVAGEALHRLWRKEEARRQNERRRFIPPDRTAGPPDPSALTDQDRSDRETLLQAARHFLIKTPTGRPALIAGYPWFGDWGRDTLIALPGLTFCCGRLEAGAAILASLADHERDGLLPNFFVEDGGPLPYNTVDASLWFFWTVQQYLHYGGDPECVRKRFWPVMKRIVTRFREGTRLGIGMDERGLLHAGDGTAALTWMDALVEDKPVTPRDGYAVEINALWYNALACVERMSKGFGEKTFDLEDLLRKIRQSFQDTFWIESEQYLGDVHSRGQLDRAIRPNQILAVSLPFTPLDPFKWKAVVRTVSEHLLTPFGLRTLSPQDPAYRGLYGGDPTARDLAYHQGTVWPWLLGHFGEASLRVAEDRAAARALLLAHLRTLMKAHLCAAGIGGVSEIFSGSPPHRPDGCIYQAWSVAELLRLYDLLEHA